ncbi:MAG: family 2 glycosyl transferase, partial [Parcubacteria group bacterium Greene0416_79]
FYTDADRQFDIREIDLLLPLIKHYDIVSGFKIERKDSPIRLWMSWIYNAAMRVLFGVAVKDINCAFKLYRKEVLKQMNFLPNVTEGIINAEIFIFARQHHFTVTQVPVHHFPRQAGSPISEVGFLGGLTFINPRVIGRFIKDTVRIAKKVYW